jgi:peptide/nickel transport system permease protein
MDISEQLNITQTQEEIEPFLEITPELAQKRRSQVRIIFDRFIRNRAAIVGAVFLLLMVLFCFLGPFVWRIGPNVQDYTAANGGPSLVHPFGTDNLGRDQFARAMVGGQVSLLVGLLSMLVALVIGVGIGAFAGYYGSIFDNVLMRVTDVFLSVPLYLLLFVLSAAWTDHTPRSVVILISAFGWMYVARLVRGEFLALKEREYVLAARTIGARDLRMMFRHILPNAAGPIIVSATLLVGSNIILESVLSYFQFGITAPTATWGNMIGDGQDFFYTDPWLVFVPGLLIFATVLCVNLVGDGLRDALDPYMTER